MARKGHSSKQPGTYLGNTYLAAFERGLAIRRHAFEELFYAALLVALLLHSLIERIPNRMFKEHLLVLPFNKSAGLAAKAFYYMLDLYGYFISGTAEPFVLSYDLTTRYDFYTIGITANF